MDRPICFQFSDLCSAFIPKQHTCGILVAFMKQNAKSHPSHEKYCLKECNMRPTES